MSLFDVAGLRMDIDEQAGAPLNRATRRPTATCASLRRSHKRPPAASGGLQRRRGQGHRGDLTPGRCAASRRSSAATGRLGADHRRPELSCAGCATRRSTRLAGAQRARPRRRPVRRRSSTTSAPGHHRASSASPARWPQQGDQRAPGPVERHRQATRKIHIKNRLPQRLLPTPHRQHRPTARRSRSASTRSPPTSRTSPATSRAARSSWAAAESACRPTRRVERWLKSTRPSAGGEEQRLRRASARSASRTRPAMSLPEEFSLETMNTFAGLGPRRPVRGHPRRGRSLTSMEAVLERASPSPSAADHACSARRRSRCSLTRCCRSRPTRGSRRSTPACCSGMPPGRRSRTARPEVEVRPWVSGRPRELLDRQSRRSTRR